MATMSIRGLDERVLARLKRQAEEEGSSLNALILRLLRQASGPEAQAIGAVRKFEDLDHLAGTWSEEDVREFEHQALPFAEVDEALWR